MDPNATLADIRMLVLQNSMGKLDHEQVNILIAAVATLDRWLTIGGFPPDDWKPRT